MSVSWIRVGVGRMKERDSVLAQMFCLRNGVRTRREEEGTEKEFFSVLCVTA